MHAPVLRTRNKKKGPADERSSKESSGVLFYPDENDWDRFWDKSKCKKEKELATRTRVTCG